MAYYRVDNIPPYLQPFFQLYGWGCGLALFGLFSLLRVLVRVRFYGEQHLAEAGTYILCQWHGYTFAHCVAAQRRYKGMILLNHPAWYMKPIHVVLHLMGVEKLVLGSTGHGGRKAADRLVQHLREGHSTWMFPDGPAGPPLTLYKGTLHIALQSGRPIIPVRVHCHRRINLPSWDTKHLPVPLSRLDITYERPLHVTENNFEDVARELPGLMSETPAGC